MLEAGRAAAQLLLYESRSSGGGGSAAALQGAAIPAPLLLPAGAVPGGRPSALPVVRCTVSLGAAGSPPGVQLRSLARQAGGTNHLTATVCCTPAVDARPGQVGAPTTARAALLSQGRGAATTAAATASACARLDQRQLASSGYFCHPAAVDATLHLGLYAGPWRWASGGAAAPAPLRVPVAAAFFLAPAQGACAGVGWPAMLGGAAPHTGSTLASYSLLSGAGGSTDAFRLQQLQSRALGNQPAIDQQQPQPQQQPSGIGPHLTSYAVEWVQQPVAESSTGKQPPAGLVLAVQQGRLALRTAASDAAAAVFGGVQAALRLLQQQGAGSPASLAALTVCGVQADPAAPPAAAVLHGTALLAAAVQGLLRAGAAEAPASAPLPHAHAIHYLEGAAPGGPPGGDIFAAPVRQLGSWHAPRLVHDEQGAAVSSQQGGLGLVLGSVAISGGMGSLGLLIAGWISVAAPAARLILWGRSAAALLPAALVAGPAEVCAMQCDAAAAADFAGVAQMGGPVEAYVHTGEAGFAGQLASLRVALTLPLVCSRRRAARCAPAQADGRSAARGAGAQAERRAECSCGI